MPMWFARQVTARDLNRCGRGEARGLARQLIRTATMLLVVLLAFGLPGCDGTQSPPTPTSHPSSATPTSVPPPAATPTSGPRPVATASAERPIVVYEPVDGQRLHGSLRLAGSAMVFEATVRFEVVDASGQVLEQGFTTATAGGPEVGTFADTVAFTPPAAEGPGTVRVFGEDPRDGGRMGLVEIPVILAP